MELKFQSKRKNLVVFKPKSCPDKDYNLAVNTDNFLCTQVTIKSAFILINVKLPRKFLYVPVAIRVSSVE